MTVFEELKKIFKQQGIDHIKWIEGTKESIVVKHIPFDKTLEVLNSAVNELAEKFEKNKDKYSSCNCCMCSEAAANITSICDELRAKFGLNRKEKEMTSKIEWPEDLRIREYEK